MSLPYSGITGSCTYDTECPVASGLNEVPERVLWGWGGCSVLKLQEQLRALVIYPHNETLATEGSWSSFLQSIPPPAGDAPRLQILQTQLTQICARQEQLLRRVDNCTQIPGWPLPPGLGLLRGHGKGGATCEWARGPLDLNPFLWQGGGFPDPGLV